MPRSPRRLEAGERTYLRAPTARDQAEFLRLVRASKKHLGGWVSPASTPKLFREHLARMRKPDMRSLYVCRREDNAIVGGVNVTQIFYGPLRSAYVGYYGFAPFAGRGYMTEGLNLMIRHAFGPMKLHRLEANIQPANAASIALVKRCGFRLEGYSPRYLKIAGRWRDHERWAITAEETR